MIILKDDRDIETEGEYDDESMPALEDASDVKYLINRELLVRKELIVQIKENKKIQCQNIFHTRCQVNNKVCSMIINGGVVLMCSKIIDGGVVLMWLALV